ncbi:MAG: hypothetical protein LJE95_10705 [Acidobacteria bacterium]|nr:hypothetical protein [Acidobacteriota bacterium]
MADARASCDFAAVARRADRRQRSTPLLAVLLLLACSWPGALLISPRAGVIGLEAPAGPSGVPAATIDHPIPEDVVDATMSPRRDPSPAGHLRASELVTAGATSQRSFERISHCRPPDPKDVHRVELLPRPPPQPGIA